MRFNFTSCSFCVIKDAGLITSRSSQGGFLQTMGISKLPSASGNCLQWEEQCIYFDKKLYIITKTKSSDAMCNGSNYQDWKVYKIHQSKVSIERRSCYMKAKREQCLSQTYNYCQLLMTNYGGPSHLEWRRKKYRCKISGL